MATIDLSFPDGTYSSSNKPSVTTLSTDLTTIETAVNALENVNIKSDAAIVASKLDLTNIATDIRFNNTIGIDFENAAGSADASILEDANDNLVINAATGQKIQFNINDVEVAYIDVDGFGKAFIGAHAYRALSSGDQTGIVPSTDTRAILDAETYDVGSHWDASGTRSYTTPVAGYYRVTWNPMYSTTEDGKTYRARVWSGTFAGTIEGENFAQASGVSTITVPLIFTKHFAADVEIFPGLFHDQGANATMEGGSDVKSYFEVKLERKD